MQVKESKEKNKSEAVLLKSFGFLERENMEKLFGALKSKYQSSFNLRVISLNSRILSGD